MKYLEWVEDQVEVLKYDLKVLTVRIGVMKEKVNPKWGMTMEDKQQRLKLVDLIQVGLDGLTLVDVVY